MNKFKSVGPVWFHIEIGKTTGLMFGLERYFTFRVYFEWFKVSTKEDKNNQ